MQFNPPRIDNIKDVLPYIKDNPAFIVKDKGWYTVIDYLYMTDTLFNCHIERECRGIKFCSKTGNILARPYHKFHNLNERADYATDKIDLTKPHTVLDKLDGSMVHTCANSLGVYLMTRMGVTEVAESADKFLMDNTYRYGRLLNALPVTEYTYIFEYVGPNNKIVLDYKEEDLILTAIRHNSNGTYVFHDELVKLGKTFGVNVVEPYTNVLYEASQLAKGVSEDTEKEGVVVRFDTGAMVKIKADAYVMKHRTKDLVSSQKGIISLIANNNLDDVLPQLDADVKKKVLEYEAKLTGHIYTRQMQIDLFMKSWVDKTQKEFALAVQSAFLKPLQSVVFNSRKGCDVREELYKLLQKNCSTNKRITELLTTLGWPLWTFSFFAEE